MGYNTRRKSLSLPSLGIHIPCSGRRASSSTTSTTTSTSTSASSNSSSSSSSSSNSSSNSMAAPSSPLLKKQKRSHEADETVAAERQQRDAVLQHTPPPSPSQKTATTATTTTTVKIDTDGIADDIVVAVIQQLEKTGNRPHLIKELAQVLSTTTSSIANSANAAALISSRLSLYLKRPWTALAPCPIAKELIPVHPRKVFFYLTNSPRQPLPSSSSDILSPAPSPSVEKEVTPCPSLSLPDLDGGADNQSEDDDDRDDDREDDRSRMSLSPEVDLDYSLDMMVATDSFASSLPLRQQQHSHSHGHRISHNHRAASPPLEGDEREFTLTASMVRERTTGDDGQAGQLRGLLLDSPLGVPPSTSTPTWTWKTTLAVIDNSHHSYFHSAASAATESPTSEAPDNALQALSVSSVASRILLLGGTAARLRAHKRTYDMSFPLDVDLADPRKHRQLSLDCAFSFSFDSPLDSWADFRSPETVDVDELDAIFADI
ncbi:hypothetical protein MGYG_01241 [Nannizzia gypsea CBS 118893]|uniref:GDS1 winged helix domain-containing protein n=1 Tax=Arthroderma gypseum (strain ATCC MYA-4604 / CBS 118893) TaxID=535722 RepID=E5QZQ4_ARTGP|nr:hypothetical protein MGYG_01241 [Nannizzia gypsea CBS 118893]EFQ98205.1 hypothetical protein MGYG_01241 [Nannizzia gypsea CBS 118893]